MPSHHQPRTTNCELIDTHAHFNNLEQAKKQVEEAISNGITNIIAIGSDIKSSHAAIKIAENIENVKATVGIHPHEAEKEFENVKKVKYLAINPPVVAIGECGLDYHYMNSPKEVQKDVFTTQINIANEINKPLVVHSRKAMSDTFAILKDKKHKETGCVMHCFSGDENDVDKLLDLGCYFAFGGVITFKNAHAADIASKIPLEKILLETDSPYLAPEPHRGKVNNPSNLLIIAQKLAELKNIDLEEVKKRTNENTRQLFNI